MQEATLRKIGNSVGLIIGKDILTKMNLEAGDKVYLVETEEGYHLTPYDPQFATQIEKAQKVMGRFRNALRVLSK